MSTKTAAARKRGVSFEVSKADSETIQKIAARAFEMAKGRTWATRLDCSMDITACHANGCPLDLQDLLNADDFNFSHDVFGIAGTLDRSTGELTGIFRPRFAKQEG